MSARRTTPNILGQHRRSAKPQGGVWRRRAFVLLGAVVTVVAGSFPLTAAPASANAPPCGPQCPPPHTLTLSADAPYQWTGHWATLTATTNYAPAPWSIEIYDQTTGKVLIKCSVGTSCAGETGYTYPTSHTYIAYIAGPSDTNPPPDIQVTSAPVTVTWSPLVLTAAQTRLETGVTTTLTASSAIDVEPTLWYIEIYDQATRRLVGETCGRTTSCSVSVSYPYPTTHTYIAYIADQASRLVPTNVQAVSKTVSVTWWTVT